MLAIIIPNYNHEQALGSLLRQLKSEGSDTDHIAPDYIVKDHIIDRIIVSDGLSHDNSIRVALSHGAQMAIGYRSRGGQLRRGVVLAGDVDWYLFLHADSRLSSNWLEVVHEHMKKGSDIAAYFQLRLDSSKFKARFVEGCVALRCGLMSLPYGDQGLLISKSLYEEIGGYPDWPLFEDVHIVEKLGRHRLKGLSSNLITSAVKYERDGFMRRAWQNLKLLRRYKKGEAVMDLANVYK